MATINCNEIYAQYVQPCGYMPVYGTAGFRADSSVLDSTVYRCGVLMALRSQLVGKACGIMITASHNKETDNGVKLIDYHGEMVDDTWEVYATELAQAKDGESIKQVLSRIYEQERFDLSKNLYHGKVIIGIDTRASGKHLARVCLDGVSALNAEPVMYGYATTPELHYAVVVANEHSVTACPSLPYTDNLIKCWKLLKTKQRTVLYVDCANGIGAMKLQTMQACLLELGLDLKLYNIMDGELNHLCGADYVEKEQTFPANMEDVPEGARCCSIDGDADRVVFFTKKNGSFHLLNGDSISCLTTAYLTDLLSPCIDNLTLGVVQTAYANGASTHYIKTCLQNVHHEYTKTGVKHLHHASKKYDIGVYFEANGHGTVLFSDKSKNALKDNDAVCQLFSQYTGDALGNLLMVDVMLQKITFEQWIDMYTNLPCKQMKFKANRAAFETTNADMVCVRPHGLQDVINNTVSRYEKCRAFVRPSGTEDVVRIYVESEHKDDVDKVTEVIMHSLQTWAA